MTTPTFPETLTTAKASELVAKGLYTFQNGRWDGAEVGYIIPTRPHLPTYMLRTLDWRITVH
jgi:hypothetical protein